MKRFLIPVIAIAGDLAAVIAVIVGCSKTDPDPQETRWHGTDSHYESTTAVHRPDRTDHNKAEKLP